MKAERPAAAAAKIALAAVSRTEAAPPMSAAPECRACQGVHRAHTCERGKLLAQQEPQPPLLMSRQQQRIQQQQQQQVILRIFAEFSIEHAEKNVAFTVPLPLLENSANSVV